MSAPAAAAAAANTAANALLWAQISAVGQVASAFATTAAVIVTLWIVLSERSIRLELSAGLKLLIAGDGSPAIDVISIHIVNRGLRVARIESIGWRTGWLRRRWPAFLARQFAMQNASVIRGFHNPPFALDPGEKKTVGVLVSDYAKLPEVDGDELFTRRFPWSRTRRAANICVIAYEVTGGLKVAKVEKSLAQFLATGKIDGGAARFNERAAAQRAAKATEA